MDIDARRQAVGSRLNSLPSGPFDVLVVGETREHFTCLKDAMDYVRKYRNTSITIYGPRQNFDTIRSAIIDYIKELNSAEYNKGREVYSRWMSQSTSWEDYFEPKEMRIEAALKFDFKASWLKNGGETTPSSRSYEGNLVQIKGKSLKPIATKNTRPRSKSSKTFCLEPIRSIYMENSRISRKRGIPRLYWLPDLGSNQGPAD